MSLAGQARRLGEEASDFRQAIFGTDSTEASVQIDYNRGEFTGPGYYTPVKQKRNTEEAGFLDEHDSIVRLRKSVWAALFPTFYPEEKKQLKIMEGDREILLTIDEILGTHPTSAEWMFGCSALNAS